MSGHAHIENTDMEEFLGFSIEDGESIEVTWSNLDGLWFVVVDKASE